MSAPCYYHPDKTATATCVQCGLPICEDCTDRVGDKTVCHKCVQAVRTRLESQMAASPTPKQAHPGGGYNVPPSTSGYPPGGFNVPGPDSAARPNARDGHSFGGAAFVLPPEVITPAQWLTGIGIALVIGILGAVVVEKFEVTAHIGLSLLYVFLGYGIGWGLLRGTKRGGTQMAAVALVIYALSVVAGLFAMASDLVALTGEGSAAAALPFVASRLGIFHWAFVAFGAYSAFQYVMRRG